ncbi:hypothetical protein [Garicola koreensis]|uniref:Uncharacterized protein n=1 Tax=Garicola koreensis TaxID=1262554 RepID=A0A7W5TSF0_9MICC|nr:hypothetical protein [Garicola koreensis]MBB3666508.1 hypothetical protein [Garicola koreensis]
MPDISMLIYPWDIETDGVDEVVGTLSELGVTGLTIAAAYHSAEVLAPRRTSRVFTRAEPNSVHLPLARDAFSGLSVPPSSMATNSPDLYPELKAATDAAGIRLDGWVVALHNSRLATQHPECAILSCFNDRFTHGLCPNNPAVRRYVSELFGGIAGSGLFERVLAESISYLLYGHGHPHELWGARLDTTTRYLLSLCFCEHCAESGAERNIDVESLRSKVAAELTRTWNQSYPAGRDHDEGLELASLHVNWPDLAAYTRMRLDTVTSLAATTAHVCHNERVHFDLGAAVWGRPSPLNWLEGVDISSSFDIADKFMLQSYYPRGGEVAREIDHTFGLAAARDLPIGELAVAMTLWPDHHNTREGFLSKVNLVRDADINTLALYNYSTATRDTLSWVADAVAVMKGER